MSSRSTSASGDLRVETYHTALISLGQASVMVLGGVLALLIGWRFGKNVETDAFFAAYGVYAAGLVFGQSLRLSALPRLVRESDVSVDRLLGAVLLVAAAAAVPMVLLAGPVGSVLVERGPNGATNALRGLWPALAGQLVAAFFSAVLTARRAFTIVGLGYLLTGFVSIGVFLALESSAGIEAVWAGLVVAGVGLAALFVWATLRTGWRLRSESFAARDALLREVGYMFAASATFFAMNLAYVVGVAVASREAPGDATLYAYAFFTASLLVGVTATSVAMVRSPRLLADKGPADALATQSLGTYRVTLLLVLPALALIAAVGPQLFDLVLGGSFSAHDGERLTDAILVLGIWVLAYSAALFAVLELLGRGRLGVLAVIAGAQLVAVVPLTIAGRGLLGLAGVALGQALAMLAAAVVQLRLAFAGASVPWVARMISDTVRGLAVFALAAAPGVAIGRVAEGSTSVAGAGLLTILLAAAAARVAWPDEARALLALADWRRPLSRGR